MADRTITTDLIGRDRMSPAFDSAGRSAQKSGTVMSKVGKVMGGALKVGALAAGGGILALGGFIGQGVKDAASYQTVLAKTAQVIKSTGGAAGVSQAEVAGLAAHLETLSGVDEELIINSQNVLATFTGIKNVGKDRIFDRATESALDMSVALGSDLQGASIQVGKALNDPIKGVGALSKVGVSFTAQQKEQIKTLVNSGHTMDAQKIILNELGKEFGGAAKAAGAGFQGSVARLQDTLADTGRTIGQALLPMLTKAADWLAAKLPIAIFAAQQAFDVFKTAFQTGTTDGGFVANAGVTLKQLVTFVRKDAIPTIQAIVGVVREWGPVLAPVGAEILAIVVALKAWQIATKTMIAVQTALDIVLTANLLGLVIAGVVALTAVIVIGMHKSETFRNVVVTVFKVISNAILGTVSNWIGAFEKVFSVLSHLPGAAGRAFKSAERAAHSARASVDGLRASINAIPTNKKVSIRVNTTYAVYGDKGGHYEGGTFVKNRAKGGPVYGPGGPTSDSIPTNLSNGEDVFSAADIRRLGGMAAVERIRRGSAPAGGGSGGGGYAGGGGGGDTYIINVHGNGDRALAEAVVRALKAMPAGAARIPASAVERRPGAR